MRNWWKRIELAHQAIPKATSVALLVNPTSATLAEAAIEDAQKATRSLGLRLDLLRAGGERDFDSVFAAFTQLQAGALVIVTDAFFISRGEQLGALALGHGVPAIFEYRPFAVAGGLMSYGTPIETYSLAGVYTGRVLKGEKPADLPVQQVTKIELIINSKTANALGIGLPLSLLGRADEVIE
jgi:putative tryptophan/tyrosine transport system substrate-binding protein